jgi:trehalose 2-sulfotransferase
MYTHHKVDHEFPETDTRVSYMVCSVPRCGSSLLCELLCNTEVAGAPTEFFDPELMGHFRARWGTSSLVDYVSTLLRKKTSPNGVFGMKAHWGQFRDVLGADSTALFPRLRYVHMRREDTLRQAVSWVRAIQTNQWASSHDVRGEPAFDREQIDVYLERIRVEDRAWEEFFSTQSISPHRIVYERLVEEPGETVGDVLAFLGLADPGRTTYGPVELEQQADALTEEWVERYESYT